MKNVANYKGMKKYCIYAALVLCGCNVQQTNIEPLPAEQVMKNAAQASTLLESAKFEVAMQLKTVGGLGAVLDGSALLHGTLHESGESVQLNAAVQATVQEELGTTDILANLDVVSIGSEEVYIRINEFTSSGERILLPPILVTAIKGTWLNIGSGVESAPQSVTPNPRLLYAQAQVLQVTEELSPAMIDERIHYHYLVKVDNEKFIQYLHELSLESGEELSMEDLQLEYADLQVDGEIWIDAQTFHVRKLLWDIAPFISQTGTSVEAKISAEFTKFNSAEPILAPESSTTPQDLLFMDVLSGGASEQMQLQTQENIIESLLTQ